MAWRTGVALDLAALGKRRKAGGWAAVRDFPVDLTEFQPMKGGAGFRYGMPSFIPLQ